MKSIAAKFAIVGAVLASTGLSVSAQPVPIQEPIHQAIQSGPSTPASQGSFPNQEAIRNAIQSGHLEQAQVGLQAALREAPQNAIAHYWLAQVLEHQGAYSVAWEELSAARRYAGNMSLGGSPQKLNAFQERLKAERFQAERQLPPQSTALGTAMPGRIAGVATYGTPVTAAATAPKTTLWSIAKWVLLTVGAIGAMAFGVSWWLKRKSTQTERGQLEQQLESAVASLKDAMKAMEGRGLSAREALSLSDRAGTLKGDLIRAKLGLANATDFQKVYDLLERAADLTAELKGQEPPSVARERAEANREQASPGVGPSTVIINNSDNSGFLNGLVAGELLSGNSHHSHHSRSYDENDDDSRRQSSSSSGGSGWDLGGSTDYGSSSSETSSSFDLGGDSSDFDL